MNIDAALDCQPSPPTLPARLRTALAGIVPTLLVAVLVLGAWQIRRVAPYSPASGLGYALGVVGGSLMLALLLYPVRKRVRFLQVLGPLKHWFRFHLAAGILGPLCVLFHSTFHVGSFNAAVALSSMLLVVASGLVGRFIYRKIHHGLFGSRASLQELQKMLNERMDALQPALARLPAIQREVDRFAELIARQPAHRWERLAHFMSLGGRRFLAGHRIGKAIAAAGDDGQIPLADLHGLARTLDAALRAAQKAAQFSTYERLFSLWHIVHIPFLWMLLITAIVHVVAVHAY